MPYQLKPADALNLAAQNWQDIHHSRNQDWKFLAILAGIIAGLVAVTSNGSGADSLEVRILLLLGIISSAWAAGISWSHWVLHVRKTAYIAWLERYALTHKSESNSQREHDESAILHRNIPYEEFIQNLRDAKRDVRDPFSVSCLIFFFHVSVFELFAIALIFCLVPSTIVNRYFPFSVACALSIVVVLLNAVAFYIFQSYMSNKRKDIIGFLKDGGERKSSPEHPKASSEWKVDVDNGLGRTSRYTVSIR